MLLQCNERGSEIKVEYIFIKIYGVVSVVENSNITVQKYRHILHIKKQLQTLTA